MWDIRVEHDRFVHITFIDIALAQIGEVRFVITQYVYIHDRSYMLGQLTDELKQPD